MVSTLALVAMGPASAATYLAQTDNDEWAVSRDTILTSGTTGSGSVTNSAIDGVLTVSRYTGLDQLARVVIRVIQPDPVVSPTIGASITIASGSDTFTSVTSSNRVTERSVVFLGDGLATGLDEVGVSVANYDITKNSTSYANAAISVGNPVARSINVSNGPTLLFDSDNESLTAGQLASIFGGAGTLQFGFDTTSEFRWARTGTSELTATLSGTNSGQIIIEYYAVPEPSAALLGAIGVLGLLRRRR